MIKKENLEKYKEAVIYFKKGMRVNKIAELTGIKRQTLYTWKHRLAYGPRKAYPKRAYQRKQDDPTGTQGLGLFIIAQTLKEIKKKKKQFKSWTEISRLEAHKFIFSQDKEWTTMREFWFAVAGLNLSYIRRKVKDILQKDGQLSRF